MEPSTNLEIAESACRRILVQSHYMPQSDLHVTQTKAARNTLFDQRRERKAHRSARENAATDRPAHEQLAVNLR